ncbi:MAG: cobalamin-dependent protein [Terriglobia bacterium]
MRILFYVPDNQVTGNFMPQLWPFVLQSLTPPEHQVTIIDGNAQHLSPEELVRFVQEKQIDLVGMGFMTRMAQSAYRMAAALRAATKVRIVMGGPHVTAVPDEPLGLTGQPQHADAVVVGEADELWPQILRDAENGCLRRTYEPELVDGKEAKPTLDRYPAIPWEQLDLRLFNLMRFVPPTVKTLLRRFGFRYDNVYAIPMETGRGCPYGCEFCTVTGFFGTSIRFRRNEDVVAEILRLKAMAKRNNGLVMTFFVDDNFAINRARTKSLLREMIANDACIPWTGQISINLLEDEELVQLIAASGARWIFMGLESVDARSLKLARKSFNKPSQYKKVLNTLAKYNLYGITSFIYGLEEDVPGVSASTVEQIDSWPPGLSVFGLLTPYPQTPLYDRLKAEGRLTRPQHWLDFRAFKTAFVPKGMTSDEAEAEVRESWTHCYSPAAFRETQEWMVKHGKSFAYQLMLVVGRLLFRGIYFPQMNRWAWLKLLAQNAPTLASLAWSGWCGHRAVRPLPKLPQPAVASATLNPEP